MGQHRVLAAVVTAATALSVAAASALAAEPIEGTWGPGAGGAAGLGGYGEVVTFTAAPTGGFNGAIQRASYLCSSPTTTPPYVVSAGSGLSYAGTRQGFSQTTCLATADQLGLSYTLETVDRLTICITARNGVPTSPTDQQNLPSCGSYARTVPQTARPVAAGVLVKPSPFLRSMRPSYRVSCPEGAATPCTGELTLAMPRSGGSAVQLASNRYMVAPGAVTAVPLAISLRGRAALHSVPSGRSVSLRLTKTSGAGRGFTETRLVRYTRG